MSSSCAAIVTVLRRMPFPKCASNNYKATYTPIHLLSQVGTCPDIPMNVARIKHPQKINSVKPTIFAICVDDLLSPQCKLCRNDLRGWQNPRGRVRDHTPWWAFCELIIPLAKFTKQNCYSPIAPVIFSDWLKNVFLLFFLWSHKRDRRQFHCELF